MISTFVWTGFICLFGYEAIMWGWTMNRHAKWLKRHPEDANEYPLVGYNRLRFVSISSSVVSILVVVSWIVLSVNHKGNFPVQNMLLSITVLLLQLSHMNLFTLIARYTCLPRSMWPLVSTLMSVLIVKYLGALEPPLSSLEVHACRYHQFRRRRGDRKCNDEEPQCGLENKCWKS